MQKKPNHKISKFSPFFLISTFLGAGKFPYMPGTIGSLIGVVLFCLLVLVFKDFTQGQILFYSLVFFIFSYVVSTIAVAKYIEKTEKKDPAEVIIDEVLAQILTLCLTTPFAASFAYGKDPWMFCAIVLLGPFLFFRFFDIVKPWPVSWVDKNIKNAFGVMFDDVVGAILAAICYNALFIIFL